MVKISQHIQKRFNQLIIFDSIRKLKILEMFQYNFFGFILVTVLAYISNKFVFDKTSKYFIKKHKTNNETDKSVMGFLILCTVTMIETFLVLIILFYMRKILLLFPSYSTRINKKFIGFTTIHSVVNLTLGFLFLEFISGYREKTKLILEYTFNKNETN